MVLILLNITAESFAQTNRPASAMCARINSLDMIKQQVMFTRTFNDANKRINAWFALPTYYDLSIQRKRMQFSKTPGNNLQY